MQKRGLCLTEVGGDTDGFGGGEVHERIAPNARSQSDNPQIAGNAVAVQVARNHHAIAAVVVGGTSLFGGKGGIPNTIIGLLVLGVVNNGLDHIQMDSFQKILIRGLILLAALVINVYVEKFRERA